MLPIRDNIQSKNFPVVNTALIGINVVIFLIQLSHIEAIDQFVYLYGLVPARYSNPYFSSQFTLSQQLFSFISFMFLHGGFLHLIGNMWTLYIFGDNVEDRLGSFYYLIFYLLSGLVSGLFHLLLNLHSTASTIGASGAVAGVMGAYFLLYPGSRILTLIPIIIIPWFVELPAIFFLGFWFLMQLFNAVFSSGFGSGIAWWAHIGGFVFGVFALKLFVDLPETGYTGLLKNVSLKRRKTPMIQVLKPVASYNDLNLHDELYITPYEAAAGSKKKINIPWGFYNRFYNIEIPPGIREGKTLRLKGLGRESSDGRRGDLLLKVRILQLA
jgi:membrane associated rhomboid family serine protease